MKRRVLFPALTFLLWNVSAVRAQNALPTSQPTVLTVYREAVKYGHNADHENTEAGWPAAYAKAKSPGTYLAVTSLTGPNEAWFIQPFANWKAYGDQQKAESSDPVLAQELARLSKADAEHVNSGTSLHLVGRADLSAGAFPNVGKIRFYEISTWRVRPGHEMEFETLAKVYVAAFKKVVPDGSYRIYQVVAGMPGPVYMIFSSTQSLADFDKMAASEGAVMGAISPQDMQAFQKFGAEGLIGVDTERFAVNGRMSYVDDATAAQDPGFWRPSIKASK